MLSFSIVTCCWNSEPYIAQCIDSVAVQRYPRIQHVFVDGGSTDGTLERIRALTGDTIIRTDVRGGISNAMNVGIESATGDVVAHLHSDDYYLNSEVLANVSELMERTGAGWVFGRIVSDIDGKLVEPTWKMPKYSEEKLLSRNFIAHPAVFVRRGLMIKAGAFDTSLRYAMDYDLWLRLAKTEAPVYLDQYLTAFRRHEGGASTANAGLAFEEDHEVRRRYLCDSGTSRAFHDAIHVWRRLRHFRRLTAD